ncbi:unnamed protein product [Ectocarpus sp. 12 AP-2014]
MVHIGGVAYVKRKNQHHRVCSCRVVYMNCITCNTKLAKRKSDYVSLMVKHAREASAHRRKCRPHEDHSFCPLTFHSLVLQRVKSSGMFCECPLCALLPRADRQRLSVRGPNKFSIDRLDDKVGYTHRDQALRLISKSHHSSQQRNAVPLQITSKKKRKWIVTAVSGMVRRSKTRFLRTQVEILGMQRAHMNVSKMNEYLGTHLLDRDSCVAMITKKKLETLNCPKCGTRLDYGDENGVMTTKNNPNRASPDRLNDRVGYVDSNVRIVCCACQTMGSIDDAEDVFLTEAETTDLVEFLERKVRTLLSLCSNPVVADE